MPSYCLAPHCEHAALNTFLEAISEMILLFEHNVLDEMSK
jgi:hypothetical protein